MRFSINIRKPEKAIGKLLAFADVILEDTIILRGFKVFQGPSELFVKPPSHKGLSSNGEESYFDDILFTGVNANDVKKELYDAVIDAFLTKSVEKKDEPKAKERNEGEKETTTKKDGAKSGRRQPLWK